jgi:hypothetical protein
VRSVPFQNPEIMEGEKMTTNTNTDNGVVEVTPAMIEARTRALTFLLPEECSLSSAQFLAKAAIRAALEQRGQK